MNYTFKRHLFVLIALIFSCRLSFGQDAAAAAATTSGADPAMVAEGSKLFQNNCTTCHKIWEDVTGPALNGVSARQNEAWLIKWIKNSAAVIKSGDKYGNELFTKWKQVAMPAHEFLTDGEVKSILAYIDSETAKGKPVEQVVAAGADGQAQESGISYNTLLGVIIFLTLIILGLLAFMVSRLDQLLNVKVKDGDVDPEAYETVLKPNFKFNIAPIHRVGLTLSVLALLFCAAYYFGYKYVGIHTGYAPTQPIAFSHELHAGQHEIECSYCHTGVERGKSATIPSVNICMNCHNPEYGIKKESVEIQKIHAAVANNRPIEWIRIHNLPDLAYFNHYQHYKVAGIQCQRCHGPVEKMQVVQQKNNITMGWCIDCHRKTEVNIDNGYYQKVHASKIKEWEEAKREKGLTISELGGMECSKCHY